MDDKQQQAQLYREQVVKPAYRKVFGVAGKRSPQQHLVWENLVEYAIEQTVWRPGADGRYDPHDAALNEGARRIAVQIKRLVESKISDEETDIKPKIKK